MTQLPPINVLFYSFFPGGGIGRYTHELCQYLNKREDINLELVCSPNFEFIPEADYPIWDGLPTLSHSVPAIRRAKFLLAQIQSPMRLIRRAGDGTDIVHFSNINHLSYPLWGKKLKQLGVKVAATAHDVRRSKATINKHYEDNSLINFYRQADALFVHSEQQKLDLIEFAKVPSDNIHLVPMGSLSYSPASVSKAEARDQFQIPKNRVAMLSFGNIRDDKNLDELLRAIANTKESRPYLVIAGRTGGSGNKNEKYYRNLILELGLDQDVLFLHRFIENTEVGDLFQAIDFSVCTYKEGFTSQSAVLNVSTYYETPILTSSAPSLKETVVLNNIGIACDGTSFQHIQIGMKNMADHLNAGHEFDFDGYNRRYSWDTNAQTTVSVYRNIVKKRN